jgi:hypothetical protein
LHHLRIIFSFLAQQTAVLPEISGSLLRRAVGIRLSSSSAFFKRQEARYVNAQNLGAKERRRKNDRLIITHQGSAWPEFGVALPDLRFLCE